MNGKTDIQSASKPPLGKPQADSVLHPEPASQEGNHSVGPNWGGNMHHHLLNSSSFALALAAASGSSFLPHLTLGNHRRRISHLPSPMCSTTRSGVVPRHRAGIAGVGRTQTPTAFISGVPSGRGHIAHTECGAVRCVQPGMAARSRGRPGPRGARVMLGGERSRVAAPPAATSGRGARSRFPLVSTYRIGDLFCIVLSFLGWSAARANSHQENWALSTLSAVFGRRATTVGGTVVAGK